MSVKTTIRLDRERGLVLELSDVSELLTSMDLVSKEELTCHLACQDDLFAKVVDLLADGFCVSGDDWAPWYPGSADDARAKLDSRLDDVATKRIKDLKRRIESLESDVARERKWLEAYKWELAKIVGRSEAHMLALRAIDAEVKP